MITLAGAMSTAELGLSLAEMIRQDKVHPITCTGANLEEDVFNLVAHDYYERVPHYRDLDARGRTGAAQPPHEPRDRHLHSRRRSDAPHGKSHARSLDRRRQKGRTLFPARIFVQGSARAANTKSITRSTRKIPGCSPPLKKNLPIFVPGWEDATLGNMYAAAVIRGDVKNVHTVRTGIEYMTWLAEFYTRTATKKSSLGLFQIGGGIAGDFPICVVPMLHQDLQRTSVPLWGYFCQISDSTTSYGSYSGAVPNEKITWGKLGVNTPKFIIESDATIVAPLIFAHVLGW